MTAAAPARRGAPCLVCQDVEREPGRKLCPSCVDATAALTADGAIIWAARKARSAERARWREKARQWVMMVQLRYGLGLPWEDPRAKADRPRGEP
jgi:hypothetical protein